MTSRPTGLTRRDMLRVSGTAGLLALGAVNLAGVPRGFGASSRALALEVFPTSPLILRPFDDPLPVPSALAPIPKSVVDTWSSPPGPGNQDFVKGAPAWNHQLWPGSGEVSGYPDPLVYQLKCQVRGHDFTTSKVQPISAAGTDVTPPGGSGGPQKLPPSTIYGFNGTFPGPLINT